MLGLSIVSIAIGVIGLFRSDAWEMRVAIIGAGILAIAALITAGRRILQLEDTLKPKFQVSCDAPGCEARNQNREDASRTPYLADFLCIEISNSVPEPIRNVYADLIEITKPSGEKWIGKSALNFAPRDREERKREPINEVLILRQDVPEYACLCTMTDRGDICFGSLNFNWADNKKFCDHLSESGEYVFKILISGADGVATKTIFVGLNWAKKREETRLRFVTPPPGNPNPPSGTVPQSTKHGPSIRPPSRG